MSLVGRQIGRYRILEQLGSGGMSVVYKGVDTALEREVAVKVLHPHLSGKEESRKRLAREAKAVAKLHHPNILEVFDFSSLDAEDSYIVTEYIRGQTLRTYVDKEPLQPPEIAAMVVHEISAALAHAHQAGVIHRDLKPENVMVREDGVLKLMDFGIAKIVDRDEKMTMTGALVGSPAHMAPEIIEGEEAGPEADVFSLGTMLYLFATGKLPFTAANTTAVLKKILDGHFEDPRTLCPAVSDGLAEIIARCLARDPAERYPDATSLRDALYGYLDSLGLARADEELAAFFLAPSQYRIKLKERLVRTLMASAERYRDEQRAARALSCVNQVLALQPDHPAALALLSEMSAIRRRQQLMARARRLGVRAAFVSVALSAIAFVGWALWPLPAQVSAVKTAALPKPPEPKPADPQPVVVVTPPEPKPETKPPVTKPETKPVTVAVVKPAEDHRPKLVPVTLQVRPYGFIQVDGGERSPQALQQHLLKLTPGKHQVRVGCDLGCDPVDEEITVDPAGTNLFRLRVQLKPSALSFVVDPPDATVRVGEVAKTAQESLQKPFEVTSPRGPSMLRHQVAYEISKPGFRTKRDVATITAGAPAKIEARLSSE